MSSASDPQVQSGSTWSLRTVLPYGRLVVLAGLLAAAYWEVLAGLVQRWAIDEPSGGGPLVPVAAAYLVWQARERLARLPARGANSGLLLMALAVGFFLIGKWTDIFLPQGISLLLMTGGMVLWLGGPAWARVLVFPIGFLFFMLPLPLIGPATVPVQVVLTGLAGAFTRAIGIPVEVSGTQLSIEGHLANVDPGCAGMRFLLTLLAAAFFVAYVTPAALWRRALLVVSALPLAFVINLVRIELSILLGRAFGPKAAEGVSHSFTGIVVFAVGVICLLYLARYICYRETGDG